MKFNSKLSLKQFLGIFFLILGLISIYFAYNRPESYRTWLILLSVLFVVHGITSFFEGTKQRYQISKAPSTGEYDSNEEKLVAEYFARKNIKFYVHPLVKVPKKWFIFDVPFKNISLHPDFFLPEYGIYVECWGMINDEKYRENFKKKKKAYEENNIEFISLYPKNLKNIDWDFTQKFMDLIRTREGTNTFGR
jgi:hypothetical protein